MKVVFHRHVATDMEVNSHQCLNFYPYLVQFPTLFFFVSLFSAKTSSVWGMGMKNEPLPDFSKHSKNSLFSAKGDPLHSQRLSLLFRIVFCFCGLFGNVGYSVPYFSAATKCHDRSFFRVERHQWNHSKTSEHILIFHFPSQGFTLQGSYWATASISPFPYLPLSEEVFGTAVPLSYVSSHLSFRLPYSSAFYLQLFFPPLPGEGLISLQCCGDFGTSMLSQWKQTIASEEADVFSLFHFYWPSLLPKKVCRFIVLHCSFNCSLSPIVWFFLSKGVFKFL